MHRVQAIPPSAEAAAHFLAALPTFTQSLRPVVDQMSAKQQDLKQSKSEWAWGAQFEEFSTSA